MKKLTVSSFGFKYGIPQDANYVFDVRFMPNPFYVEELRPLTGMDERVRQYIMSFEVVRSFLDSSILFLDFVVPRFLEAEKETLHVAVGCTGGRHRSVAFAVWLYERYKNCKSGPGRSIPGFEAEIRHRDIA